MPDFEQMAKTYLDVFTGIVGEEYTGNAQAAALGNEMFNNMLASLVINGDSPDHAKQTLTAYYGSVLYTLLQESGRDFDENARRDVKEKTGLDVGTAEEFAAAVRPPVEKALKEAFSKNVVIRNTGAEQLQKARMVLSPDQK